MNENLMAADVKCNAAPEVTHFDPSEPNWDSIEMILRRKLMFYIEDKAAKPFTVDTGITIERICNESSMDVIEAFIDEFDKKYSDAKYEIVSNTGGISLPTLMILVTPTP